MFVIALLAASLFTTAPAAPTASCLTPANTGTYRFTALTKDSTNAKIGMLVLENIEGCLEATLLTDDGGPAVIDHLALTDGVLTGNVRVASGSAKVTLRFTSSGATGSIVDGKKEWSVAARRTSGAALDVAVVK
jgi:hypothetical protein